MYDWEGWGSYKNDFLSPNEQIRIWEENWERVKLAKDYKSG